MAATILLIAIGASLPFALEAPKAVDIYIDVALMAIAGILALIAGWWARHESSGIKGALLLGAISLIVFGLIFSFTPDPVKFRAAQFVFSFAVSFFIDTGWNAIKSRTAAKSAA